MSNYQVFARKYRPQTFDEVVGQEHITQTLKNAITSGRLAHAYLFVGPRGTGKTSTARILAKALNCVNGPTVTPCGVCDACREIAAGNSLDVMEIDGASNNGVEQVRELRDNVRFAPTHGKYKIYIIDEVHMLTTAAFNALLKTLEEPPEHVKFVFATTDVQKVLPTILSRCQRFDLRRIPAKLIAEHLQYIAGREKITLEPEAARAIAKGAEGGLRDAESMLDQLVAFCGEKIGEADVLSVFGFTAAQTVSHLCDHLLDGDAPAALGIVQEQAQAGRDLSRLMADLIGHIRNLLVAKANPEGIQAEVGPEAMAALQAQADRLPLDRLLELIEQFAAAESRMKWVPNKKLHFEIAVIKAIQTLGQATLTEVIDTLTALKTGGELPAHATAAPRPLPPSASRPATKPVSRQPEAPRHSLVAAFKKTATETATPREPATHEPVPTEPATTSVSKPAPNPEPKAPEEPESHPREASPSQPAASSPAPAESERAPWEDRPAASASKPEPSSSPEAPQPTGEATPEPETKQPVKATASKQPEAAPEAKTPAEATAPEPLPEDNPVQPVKTELARPEPEHIPRTMSLFGPELFGTPEPPTVAPEVKPEPEETPATLEEPEAQVAKAEPDKEPASEPVSTQEAREPVKAKEPAGQPEAAAPAPEPMAPLPKEPPIAQAVVEEPLPSRPEEEEPTAGGPSEPAQQPHRAAQSTTEAPAETDQAGLWPKVIRYTREKRPLISRWLELGAFRGIHEGKAILAFPQDSAEASLALRSLQKPEQIRFLKEAFAHAGSPAGGIGFETLAPGETVPPVEIPEENESVKDPMVEFRDDPLIKHALEVFKAEIQLG